MAKEPQTGNVAGSAPVTVTYVGPTDTRDRSTSVVVQHGGTHPDETFPIGRKVETSKTTAKRLADMAGHKFKIEGGQ